MQLAGSAPSGLEWEWGSGKLGSICGHARHQQCDSGQFHVYGERFGVGWTPGCPPYPAVSASQASSYAWSLAQSFLFAWQVGGKMKQILGLEKSILMCWCVFPGWWRYISAAVRHLCVSSLSQAWELRLHLGLGFGIRGYVCLPLWAHLWCGAVEVAFMNFLYPTWRKVSRNHEGSSLHEA